MPAIVVDAAELDEPSSHVRYGASVAPARSPRSLVLFNTAESFHPNGAEHANGYLNGTFTTVNIVVESK